MSTLVKISNEHEYHSAMSQIDSYIRKGFSNLTEDEEKHLEGLSKAVEEWELIKYPMPI